MTGWIPSRVFVCRLGAIGDVTNALVVANALRAARPEVTIGWAVHDLCLPLVTDHPSVDRVHLWKRGSGVGGWRALLAEVRAGEYELALDLQRLQKSALLARLSGAPRVLGFDRARAKELSWMWTRERVEPGPAHEHMIEQYMRFVRLLGIEDSEPRRLLPTDAAAEAWADELVGTLAAAPIVINVGASKPPNRWAPERFAELAEIAAQRFEAPVCLTGGPEDRELAAGALEPFTAGEMPRVHDLVGRTSLPELISLLRRARLFVGCDTGPMHLAAAVETRAVALFGPADPRRTGPWGSGHRVVRSPHPENAMEGIGVDLVLEEMERALDS